VFVQTDPLPAALWNLLGEGLMTTNSHLRFELLFRLAVQIRPASDRSLK